MTEGIFPQRVRDGFIEAGRRDRVLGNRIDAIDLSLSEINDTIYDASKLILVAGTGVTLTPDDIAKTIAINGSTNALTLGGQNSAYHLARANHTGTQLAASISDFGTAVAALTINAATLGGQNSAYHLSRTNHTGTQLANTISDLTETTQDTVAGMLVAGSNISLTYDDPAGTITIAASGGSSVTPSALTRTNDTNVTLTLGGTPATALLQAVSLTLGWTGTLDISRGGSGASTAAGARTAFGLGTIATKDDASAAEIRAFAADKAITLDDAATASAIVSLTDGATVSVDWASGINFDVTLGGNRALGNPTNVVVGTFRTVLVKASSGTRTLTFGSNFKGDIPTINDVTSTKWYLLSLFAYTSTHIVIASVRAL